MFSLLTQEDIADGWNIVMKKKKYKDCIEAKIYLSQLPPHLWKILIKHYPIKQNIIIDKVFKFKLKKSKYDDKVIELFNAIMSNNKNINYIEELYNYCLSNNILGWLMIKTKEILANYNR
jgi:hypothetical protein